VAQNNVPVNDTRKAGMAGAAQRNPPPITIHSGCHLQPVTIPCWPERSQVPAKPALPRLILHITRILMLCGTSLKIKSRPDKFDQSLPVFSAAMELLHVTASL
jgi:hypothetical protein